MKLPFFKRKSLKSLSFKQSQTQDYDKVLVNASIVLWCVSLFLPAFTVGTETYEGYRVLIEGILFGWLGLIFQPYSNLTFWLTIVLISKEKSYIWSAWVTFLLGFSSFVLTTLPVGGDRGIADVALSWELGSLVWIVSYTMLVLKMLYKSFS